MMALRREAISEAARVSLSLEQKLRLIDYHLAAGEWERARALIDQAFSKAGATSIESVGQLSDRLLTCRYRGEGLGAAIRAAREMSVGADTPAHGFASLLRSAVIDPVTPAPAAGACVLRRSDGSAIDRLVLRADHTVEGSGSLSGLAWRAEGHVLQFVDAAGVVTLTFADALESPERGVVRIGWDHLEPAILLLESAHCPFLDFLAANPIETAGLGMPLDERPCWEAEQALISGRYRPFVIVGRASAGSAALARSLTATGRIHCTADLFDFDGVVPCLETSRSYAALRLRRENPERFLSLVLSRAYAFDLTPIDGVRERGFTLALGQNDIILDHVAHDPAYRLLRVRRENALAEYAQLMANAGRQHFSAAAFTAFLDARSRHEKSLDLRLLPAGGRTCDVSYRRIESGDLSTVIGFLCGAPGADLAAAAPPAPIRRTPLDEFDNPEDVLSYLAAVDRLAWADGAEA